MFTNRINVITKVEAMQNLVPHIFISNEALTKMSVYVETCKQEVGWLGTVITDEETGYPLIDDVYLFDQEVHATTTEITPEGLTEFAEELLSQGDKGMETWNNLKMWGHSHVNMGITPSGQDNKQMETFAESGHDWFLRLIANKKGELKIDMYDYVNGVTYLDLPWKEQSTAEQLAVESKIAELQKMLDEYKEETYKEMEEEIVAEMKIKVRPKVYTAPKVYGVPATHNAPKTYGSSVKRATKHTHVNPYDEAMYEDELTGHSILSYYNSGHYVGEGISELDAILTDDDVESYIGKEVLIELNQRCHTIVQLEEDLIGEGYEAFFTDNDLERIFRVMRKTKI